MTQKATNRINFFLSKPYWFYAIVVLLIGLAGYLLYYDMHFGPWAFSDSAEYIISAKNLVEGNGLGLFGPDGKFMPLTLHPPFYSFMLAPLFALNLDVFILVKWLNILFFCGSLFLLFMGIFRITKSTLFSLSIGILFLVSPVMLNNFDGVMTEPLFIFLSIANLILLNLYIKENNKWYFWGAVLTACFATLTRYIGFASIFSGFLFLIFFSTYPWKKRISISLTYAVLALIPVGIWFVYVGIISNTMASRTIDLSKSILQAININRFAFTEVVAEWLPFRTVWFSSWKSKVITIYSTLLLSGGLVVLTLVLWWKKRVNSLRSNLALVICAGIYIVAYFSFLIVSYFSTLPPDLNERMFSPLLIFIFILIFGSLFNTISFLKLPKAFAIIPVAFVLILGISYWQQTRSEALDRHMEEFSYSSPSWKNSEIIAEVKKLDGRPLVYSNHPVGILLHTGVFPYEISNLSDRLSENKLPDDFLIVLFSPIENENQLIMEQLNENKITEQYQVDLTFKSDEGEIIKFFNR